MFSTKCKTQNDRMGCMAIWSFRQKLDFPIGFAIQISMYTPAHPFVFSLSNWFIVQEVCFLYVQYIRWIYPIYLIYPICPIYPMYSIPIHVLKTQSGTPPTKWKDQHIFPFGLCVKGMTSRCCLRPTFLPPVRNLTEFGKQRAHLFFGIK